MAVTMTKGDLNDWMSPPAEERQRGGGCGRVRGMAWGENGMGKKRGGEKGVRAEDGKGQ